VMRYAGPFQVLSARVPEQPIRIADTDIPPGRFVVAAIEQAHHDPTAYDDPGAFDIARRGPPVLGFGTGAHSCLGAGLARLETSVMLRTLFSTWDAELLDSAPDWQNRQGFRRLDTLRLRLRPVERRLS
jgi:cytochrome P450